MAKLMLSVNSEDWTIIEEGSQNCDHCPLRFIYDNPKCDEYYEKLFGKSCTDSTIVFSKINYLSPMKVESFTK